MSLSHNKCDIAFFVYHNDDIFFPSAQSLSSSAVFVSVDRGLLASSRRRNNSKREGAGDCLLLGRAVKGVEGAGSFVPTATRSANSLPAAAFWLFSSFLRSRVLHTFWDDGGVSREGPGLVCRSHLPPKRDWRTEERVRVCRCASASMPVLVSTLSRASSSALGAQGVAVLTGLFRFIRRSIYIKCARTRWRRRLRRSSLSSDSLLRRLTRPTFFLSYHLLYVR